MKASNHPTSTKLKFIHLYFAMHGGTGQFCHSHPGPGATLSCGHGSYHGLLFICLLFSKPVGFVSFSFVLSFMALRDRHLLLNESWDSHIMISTQELELQEKHPLSQNTMKKISGELATLSVGKVWKALWEVCRKYDSVVYIRFN